MSFPGARLTGKGPNSGLELPGLTGTAAAWDPTPTCEEKVTRRFSSTALLPIQPGSVLFDVLLIGSERVKNPSQVVHVLTLPTKGAKVVIWRVPSSMRCDLVVEALQIRTEYPGKTPPAT